MRLAALLALLTACTPPERSLVRCIGTASAFDADVGLVAWVEPLTRTHFAACYSPEADLCTVLPAYACTVRRLR